MKEILSKIRAFFTFKGEAQEMVLSAAEVKKDKIFLHPADDPQHTYLVKTKTVDIFINPEEELSESDIEIFDTNIPRHKTNKKTPESDPTGEEEPEIRYRDTSHYIPQRRRLTLLLYPEEYDMVMSNIQTNGYKKTEYFLACVKSANKRSVQTAYNFYTKFHKEKRQEDLHNAQIAREKDYRERVMAARERMKQQSENKENR